MRVQLFMGWDLIHTAPNAMWSFFFALMFFVGAFVPEVLAEFFTFVRWHLWSITEDPFTAWVKNLEFGPVILYAILGP